MSRFDLTPATDRIELAPGWGLRAPGYAGNGDFRVVPVGERRASDFESLGALDEAISAVGMSERAVAGITIDPESPVRAARRRGETVSPESVSFEVPPPPEGFEQVMLVACEDGTVTWHVEYELVAAAGRRGGLPLRRYHIPIRPGEARPAAAARRGLFSAVTRRLLKVLVFPVTDFLLGALERGIARAWESSHTPYGLRTFDAGNYQQKGAGALSAADWTRLASGPALLFVHGTFSTAHGCFGRMPRQTLTDLSQRYGGRTFALDHWTLSHDPRDNAKWLLDRVPAGLSLDVDIVCHSRGGLVSRVLANGLGDLTTTAERVRVGRIVFVATPNDGTPLASADHMVAMLDRYTNLVQFIPDGPFEVVLECIVTAIKTLAHAGLAHLPGLAAQSPGSEFLEWLQARPTGDTRYYGIAADWEPAAGSPLAEMVKQHVADRVMDGVFKDAMNDLVVPTLGVGETTTGPGFPIPAAQRYTFPSDSGAIHTNLFGHPETATRLLEWLTPRGGGPGN